MTPAARRVLTVALFAVSAAAGVARAQPIAPPAAPAQAGGERTTRLVAAGSGAGEVLAITFTHPDHGDATKTTTHAELRRRPPGAGHGEWSTLARYRRPILAVAHLSDTDLAVLLGPAGADAGASDLRLLSVAADLSAISDPSFDPRARPVEGTTPPPPEGVRWLDVAAARLDGSETRRRLAAVGDDGAVYALGDGQAWRRLAALPENLTDPDLAGGDRLTLAGRDGGAAAAFAWDGESWQSLGTAPLAAEGTLTLVGGVPKLAGGPLLILSDDEGDRIVRFGEDGVTSAKIGWPAGSVDPDAPRSAALALGSVRLTRTFASADAAFGAELSQIALDPRSLAPLAGESAEPVAVHLRDPNLARVGQVMVALWVAVLGLALFAIARRPRNGAAAQAAPATIADEEALAAGPIIAPLGPRVTAALIDALPLFFGLGLYVSTAGRLPAAASILVVTAALIAFVALPLVGELASGRSPGKAALGLRAVSRTGGPASAGAVVLRNLLRPVDLLVGWIALVTPDRRRLGDLAAGTVVVIDRPIHDEAEDAA